MREDAERKSQFAVVVRGCGTRQTYRFTAVPLADTSLADQVGGALRGVKIGVPAGAAVGLGLAASLLGSSPEVMAGMAGAGARARWPVASWVPLKARYCARASTTISR